MSIDTLVLSKNLIRTAYPYLKYILVIKEISLGLEYTINYHFMGKGNPLILVFAVLLLYSCGCLPTKENYINDFTLFINEVQLDHKKYTEEDWAAMDVQYEVYATEKYEKYKDDLTSEERELIGNLKGQYNGYKTPYEINETIEDIKDAVKEGVQEAKGFIEAIGEAFEGEEDQEDTVPENKEKDE